MTLKMWGILPLRSVMVGKMVASSIACLSSLDVGRGHFETSKLAECIDETACQVLEEKNKKIVDAFGSSEWEYAQV